MRFYLILKNYHRLESWYFGSFTVFTAIPNKFWINSPVHPIVIFVISIVIYLLGFVFPFLFLCYIVYLILCFESFMFGFLYEHSKHFRRAVNYLLFGSPNEPFAKDYFHWFWGNMWQRATKKVGPALAAAAAIEARRQQENRQKEEYADKHIEQASNNTEKGFKDPAELANYHKERRDEWVQENGVWSGL